MNTLQARDFYTDEERMKAELQDFADRYGGDE